MAERLRLNVPVVVEDDPNATAVTGVYRDAAPTAC